MNCTSCAMACWQLRAARLHEEEVSSRRALAVQASAGKDDIRRHKYRADWYEQVDSVGPYCR
jgi:hypothetical protein